jgi:hypothetical protein
MHLRTLDAMLEGIVLYSTKVFIEREDLYRLFDYCVSAKSIFCVQCLNCFEELKHLSVIKM